MGDAAGSTLQNYNSELVGCIEELREKREELNRSIAQDEEEKAKIQNDLRILTERLARINDNLARKVRRRRAAARRRRPARRRPAARPPTPRVGLAQVASRTEYDKTITETEGAYAKIMESSQVSHTRRKYRTPARAQPASPRGGHSSLQPCSPCVPAAILAALHTGALASRGEVTLYLVRRRDAVYNKLSC